MNWEDYDYIYSRIKCTDCDVSVHFVYKGEEYFAEICNTPCNFDEDDGEFTLCRGTEILAEESHVVLGVKPLINRIREYFDLERVNR